MIIVVLLVAMEGDAYGIFCLIFQIAAVLRCLMVVGGCRFIALSQAAKCRGPDLTVMKHSTAVVANRAVISGGKMCEEYFISSS